MVREKLRSRIVSKEYILIINDNCWARPHHRDKTNKQKLFFLVRFLSCPFTSENGPVVPPSNGPFHRLFQHHPTAGSAARKKGRGGI